MVARAAQIKRSSGRRLRKSFQNREYAGRNAALPGAGGLLRCMFRNNNQITLPITRAPSKTIISGNPMLRTTRHPFVRLHHMPERMWW
jgi:hypothetical protein